MMSVSTAILPTSGSAAMAKTVPRDWPNRAHSQVVESFGTRWHVQRAGRGDALVLIHGTAASTHSFRDLLPALAERFTVIAVDIPGHGFTSRLPDKSMSLTSIARALAGLFETLGVQPRYLVGHSAGAAIVLRHALDRPDGIDAVVGLNAALLPYGGMFRHLFSPMAQFFASTRLMPLMLARRAADRKAVARIIRGTGSVLDDEGIAYYQRLFTSEAHLEAVLAMMAAWDLSGLERELADLAPRLMLVTGQRDQAVRPETAGAMARKVPNARVVELERCGHLAHEERPAEVAQTIERFLTGGIGVHRAGP